MATSPNSPGYSPSTLRPVFLAVLVGTGLAGLLASLVEMQLSFPFDRVVIGWALLIGTLMDLIAAEVAGRALARRRLLSDRLHVARIELVTFVVRESAVLLGVAASFLVAQPWCAPVTAIVAVWRSQLEWSLHDAADRDAE